jgi:hypothetical protein
MSEVNADSSRLLARYLPRPRRSASGRLPLGLQTLLDTGDLVGQRENSYPPQKTQRQYRVGRRIRGARTASRQDGRQTLTRLGW